MNLYHCYCQVINLIYVKREFKNLSPSKDDIGYLESKLGTPPMTTLSVVSDLGIRLETEPRGDRPVEEKNNMVR
jgi:hypothetical protein